MEFIKEKTCGFTGHRPDKLGNAYGLNHPVILKLKEVMYPILEDLIVSNGYDTFISGGALGGDTVFFYTVALLKKKYPHIKNIVAIPFKNQPNSWKKKECTPCLYLFTRSKELVGNEYNKCRNCTFRETQYWYSFMLHLADEIIYVDETENYQLDKKSNVGEFSNYKMQVRNMFMVDVSSSMVAVWDGDKSGGTYNCVNYAIQKKRNIHHLNPKLNFQYTLF